MSVDEVAIADAEARAAGAQLDGVAASQLKAGFDDAYGEATSLLTQLEDLAHAIDEAHEEVCAKILDPEVPPPKPADSSALREELAHVVVETSTGRWVAAQGLLAQWSDHARAEVLESRRTLDAIRAPLEQRKQMRGLLDAYHAKGVATGMLEDENAGQLYDRTRAALYTAPTDLDGAAGLLRLFGRSVSGSDVLEGVE